MGSKKRLLPWSHGVLQGLDFETAMDPFSGSGSVAYLMKAMGRRVVATDFLNVSATVARVSSRTRSLGSTPTPSIGFCPVTIEPIRS
ncbi:DNA adenine methylase [Methylobacterium sp. WL120]|uniref:DNA adenine methylase n=1 Tax=Methylobacterium sp. WL120 TaxID=2603887 RepID=UPI001FEF324F|nr:DNA adenine methylase [Methylobacterium sp. WL120]